MSVPSLSLGFVSGEAARAASVLAGEPEWLLAERLEAAGISWKIYEDMADNFGDNPLVGFKAYRDSLAGTGNPALAAKGLATQHLDVLLSDVKGGTLPQVSWVMRSMR